MEEYGEILLIVMLLFLVLIILGKTYGAYKREDSVPIMDSVSSVSSSIANAGTDVLRLSIIFISFGLMVSKMAVFYLETNIFTYLVAFIIIDFYGYWTYFIAHQVNFSLNKHTIHHSSEEFNLVCTLKQTVSSFINLFPFLLIPAAIIEVPIAIIVMTLLIQLFLQFWYHTKHIKKVGFLEHILITPSQHNVHQAIKPKYIDKNYSQIFIIWDKLFHAFQEELEEPPPVYGITRPVKTWNPIRIKFQHLGLLISDAWHDDNKKDRFAIWFKYSLLFRKLVWTQFSISKGKLFNYRLPPTFISNGNLFCGF
jgi:alkylglycerol monooxygenase